MENDVLKNKIAPWQEKGRWYHAVVEVENSEWILLKDESDAFFSTSELSGAENGTFTVSTDTRFAIIDYYVKPRSGLPAEAEFSYLKYIDYFGTGFSIYLPSTEDCHFVDGFTLDIWFFIDKVE